MSLSSRGKRLAGRYPVLSAVPEADRPAVVRAALRHPLLLLGIVGVGIGLLPLYFEFAFTLLRVEQEPNIMLKMTKMAGAVLLPVITAVPLLTRFVMPRFIVREMRKRGFTPASADGGNDSSPSSPA